MDDVHGEGRVDETLLTTLLVALEHVPETAVAAIVERKAEAGRHVIVVLWQKLIAVSG